MPKKASPGARRPVRGPFVDRGGPLPRAYAHNRIVPLVRDPEHIWIYWDVETDVRVAAASLLIRVHCLSEDRFWDLLPGPEADNWYLRLAPDRTYRFELYERRDDNLRLLATSREATTPVRWSGQSAGELPAEVIHAEIHPLTRPTRPLKKSGAAPVKVAKRPSAAAPALRSPLAASARRHRAPRFAPLSGAPVPVPAPLPLVFSDAYASGRGK